MSDLNHISDKLRQGTAVTTTTSETIRLDYDRTNVHLHSLNPNLSAQNLERKKTSSFQITSVVEQPSSDIGDDSADDTEETSEIIRMADVDQETPSYSEDLSKSEDAFFNPAPIITAGSQYGITALVQETTPEGLRTARLPQGVTVNVTEDGIALAKAEVGDDDTDNWHKRFTIVKIDSNKQVKRGRWSCLDFMNSPGSETKKGDNEYSNNSITFMQSDNNSSVVVQVSAQSSVQSPIMRVQSSQPVQFMHPQNIAPSSSQVSGVPSDGQYSGHLGLTNQVHSISQGFASSSSPVLSNVQQPTVSMPSGSGTAQMGMMTGLIPLSLPSQSVSSVQSSTTPQQAMVPPHSMGIPSNVMPQSNVLPGIAQNHLGTIHPIISQQSQIPSNVLQQSGGAVQSSPMTHQMSVPQVPSSHPGQPQIPNASEATVYSSVIASNTSNPPSTIQLVSSQQIPVEHIQQTQVSQPLQHPKTLEALPSSPYVDESSQTPPTASASVVIQNEDTESFQGLALALSADVFPGNTSAGQSAPSDSSCADSKRDKRSSVVSASTTNTVAIDNKIEQAMDLVKSHLMYAVREEVEVLRDRIGELMEKITRLEGENQTLRNYAPQDVIQQLQIQQQQQTGSHHSSNNT